MDPLDPVEMAMEPEVLASRRAFAHAQAQFRGGTGARVTSAAAASWYGSNVYPEGGALAVVRPGGALEDYVGEVLYIQFIEPGAERHVYVYVPASSGAVEDDVDIALARRAFLELVPLYRETISVAVAVVA